MSDIDLMLQKGFSLKINKSKRNVMKFDRKTKIKLSKILIYGNAA